MILPYSTLIYPPVPVLEVLLSAPAMDDWQGAYTAIIDSGADITIVPFAILQSLNSPVMRPVVLSSQWRDRHSVYIYKVDIQVDRMIFPAVDVAGDPGSGEILLGRNVLNRLDLRLEGPALRTHLPVV